MSAKDAAGSCLEGTPAVPVDLILQAAFFYGFGQTTKARFGRAGLGDRELNVELLDLPYTS